MAWLGTTAIVFLAGFAAAFAICELVIQRSAPGGSDPVDPDDDAWAD